MASTDINELIQRRARLGAEINAIQSEIQRRRNQESALSMEANSIDTQISDLINGAIKEEIVARGGQPPEELPAETVEDAEVVEAEIVTEEEIEKAEAEARAKDNSTEEPDGE